MPLRTFRTRSASRSTSFELPLDEEDPKPGTEHTVYLTVAAIGGRGTLRLRVYGVRAYDSPSALENGEIHQLHLDQVYLHSTNIPLPDLRPISAGGRRRARCQPLAGG